MNNNEKTIGRVKRPLYDMMVTLLVLFISLIIAGLIVQWTSSSTDVAALFTLAVLLVSYATEGYAWGILASVIGVFAVNVVFTAPIYQLNLTMRGYPLIFLAMLMISIITSAMTRSIKKQAIRAQAREQRTQKLYDFSQQLANTSDPKIIIELTLQYLYAILDRTVLFVETPDSMEKGEQVVCGSLDGFFFDMDEQEALRLCFQTQKRTGARTGIVTHAMLRYIPLQSKENMLGCFGILWKKLDVDRDLEEHVHLILAQTGMTLERQRMAEERNQAAMEADREKMRGNLLRAISHDLRTPLTGIMGASAAILENGERLEREEVYRLMLDINNDADWLLRMVENLLSVTRVTEAPELRKVEEAAEEVVMEAVSRCRKRYPDIAIRASIPEEMLFVPMDVTLIVQVLMNLIENAVRYGAAPIEVELQQKGNCAKFIVRDHGEGIPVAKRETLFVAQQPPSDSRRGGLGIGLTLCYSIIHAHHGTIYEINHPDGGAQFIFILPLEEET